MSNYYLDSKCTINVRVIIFVFTWDIWMNYFDPILSVELWRLVYLCVKYIVIRRYAMHKHTYLRKVYRTHLHISCCNTHYITKLSFNLNRVFESFIQFTYQHMRHIHVRVYVRMSC